MCGFVRDAGHFFTFYIVILFTFWAMGAFFRLMGTVTMDFNVAARLAAALIVAMVVCASSPNLWIVELLILTFP